MPRLRKGGSNGNNNRNNENNNNGNNYGHGNNGNNNEEPVLTPLMQAIKDRNLGEVKRLIEEEGKDVNEKDTFGSTALQISVVGGEETLEITKYLIEKGADVNTRDNGQMTPLQNALLAHSHLETIQYLVENEADVNAKGGPNNQPALLFINIFSENAPSLIEYLVNNGAAVNATDKYGNTALHFAVEYGKENVINKLLEKGADPNKENNNHESPIHLDKNRYITMFLLPRSAPAAGGKRKRKTRKIHKKKGKKTLKGRK